MSGLDIESFGKTLYGELESDLRGWSVYGGELTLDVKLVALERVMTYLRDASRFAQLIDVCGVDYPGREERFDVVYHLLSLSLNCRIRLKVAVKEEEAVPTLCQIYSAANWYEREVFDLYGIPFSGHPDLRRILTDYGFEGHPLRKDFPLWGDVEVRYDEDMKKVIYEPVNLSQPFRNFDFMSPWEGMLPGDEKRT